MYDYRGKRIAVTGGASGIGKETARYFLRSGAELVLLDANRAALDAAVHELSQSGMQVAAYHADVSRPESVQAAFSALGGDLGGLDVLVCAAGVLRTGRIDAMDEADWNAVIGVNLSGVFHSCRAALPLLRRPEGYTGSHRKIAVIASASGMHPKVALGAYSASKQGVANLVRVLAAELAAERINVNGVAPGTIDTPMVAGFKEAGDAPGGFRLYGAAPIGRLGRPEDVAHAIAYLCSEQADFVSGAMLAVDGAATAVFPSPA